MASSDKEQEPTPGRWLAGQRHLAGAALNLAVGLGLADGLLLIWQAHLLARVVNGVVVDRAPLETLWPWLLTLPAIFALRAAIARSAERVSFTAAARVKAALRKRLYRHLRPSAPPISPASSPTWWPTGCSRTPPSCSWTSPPRVWTPPPSRPSWEALCRLMEGRSVLLITHRLVGLERMDEILVLVRGRVVERGTHAGLLAAGGVYAGMHARLGE